MGIPDSTSQHEYKRDLQYKHEENNRVKEKEEKQEYDLEQTPKSATLASNTSFINYLYGWALIKIQTQERPSNQSCTSVIRLFQKMDSQKSG